MVELQDTRPEYGVPLELVGFRGVRRRVRIDSPEGPIDLDLSIDVYVSIGSERRGAHLSRHVEAVDAPLRSYRSIESYLEAVADTLLSKHSYADKVMVKASTVYYVDVEYAGIRGREPVEVEVEVVKDRNGGRRWTVSVTVRAITVCPSAQATIASLQPGYDGLPAPSHVQRVRITGRVTTPAKMVRIEDIARALWDSASAPVFTLLKRSQEARLVYEAHRRPRFAEDVARHAIVGLARRLVGRVPEDTVLEAEVDSEESIHPHNVYAYTRATIKQILAVDRNLDVVE